MMQSNGKLIFDTETIPDKMSRLFPKPPPQNSQQQTKNDGHVPNLDQKLQDVTNERDVLLGRCQEYERKLSGLNTTDINNISLEENQPELAHK